MDNNKENEKILPLAKASLILGVMSCIAFGLITAVPAIICGVIALRKIRYRSNTKKSRRLSNIGIFFGIVGLLMTIVIIFITYAVLYDKLPYGIELPTK